jgi:hypothetical protein
MIKTLEFKGLRFHTSFNFKNKKEKGKYFDNLLLESTIRFKNELSKYFNEKLHVLISYSVIFIIFGIGTTFLALLALLFNNISLFFYDGVLTCIFMIISLTLYNKFKISAFKCSFTEAINTDKFLEDLQQELINSNKKKEN